MAKDKKMTRDILNSIGIIPVSDDEEGGGVYRHPSQDLIPVCYDFTARECKTLRQFVNKVVEIAYQKGLADGKKELRVSIKKLLMI